MAGPTSELSQQNFGACHAMLPLAVDYGPSGVTLQHPAETDREKRKVTQKRPSSQLDGRRDGLSDDRGRTYM